VALGLGDQHLGWLGDLAEVAALLGGTLAWEKSLALPASDSQVAWDLARMPSADALRWAAYAGTTPAQAERDLLRPLWRSAVALADRPGTPAARLEADNVLERWLMARLQQTIQAVSRALDGLEPGRAAEALQALVLDLEDWVVPHRPEGGGKVLEVLSRLVAPFVPHLAEAIHRRWAGPLAPSVHLAAWPIAELEGEERMLLADMAHVQRWVELGRRVRAQEGLDPGQPLHRAVVSLLVGGPAELGEANLFEGLLAKMLGVSQVQIAPVKKIRVTWRLSLDLEHGVERDLAPAEIEAVLEGMDAEESARLASELWAGLSVGLEVSGRAITLLPDEVCTTAQAPPGWAAATDAQHLVVLSVG
jgi:isoleucyl-tRNA synthetase